MKKFFLNENKGFTLLEVMLAILILVILIIPLVDVGISATEYYRDAKEKTRLLNFAKMKLEEIKALSLVTEKSGFLDSGIKYEVSLSDYEKVDSYILKKVTVSVYPEGEKSEKEVRLTTLIKVEPKNEK